MNRDIFLYILLCHVRIINSKLILPGYCGIEIRVIMDEKYDILPDIQNSLKLWCSQYDFHEPYNQQFHDFLHDTLRRVTDMINSEKNETEYTGFIKKWDKIDSLKKRKF